MAFLAEDDDAMHAFEAVLSYVEDFSMDMDISEGATGNSSATTEQSVSEDTGIPTLDDLTPVADAPESKTTAERAIDQVSRRSNGSKSCAKKKMSSEAALARRRAADNARKKMLRKAGVYGNPNRARNERKLEIAYLREKVGQLEVELKRLQKHSLTGLEGGVPNGAELVNCGETRADTQKAAPGVWSGVAVRQKNRREKAERENVRLKLILEGQIKVAKSLESLLLKRAQQQVAECSSVQVQSDLGPLGGTFDYRTDASDFRHLLEYLDAAYRNVDAVLTKTGLADMEMSQQDVFMREGVDGMYMELFSNKVMPFECHATAEATWNYMKGSQKHRGKLYAKEVQNLDTPYTIIEHFSKQLVAGNSSTDVRIRQVVRRYVEAEREVVVWVATITPIEVTRKPFAGLSSHHRNYAVIKRAKLSTPEQELSLLQLVAHVKLDTIEGTVYDPKYMRAVTDFLLSNAAGNIKADQELIESVLMDQTLHSRQT